MPLFRSSLFLRIAWTIGRLAAITEGRGECRLQSVAPGTTGLSMVDNTTVRGGSSLAYVRDFGARREDHVKSFFVGAPHTPAWCPAIPLMVYSPCVVARSSLFEKRETPGSTCGGFGER
jgi:hypothetical protein